ncbi:CCA tRNA nucleotidyltransferase [Komagataeibacter swingsii]|uniref:Poly(A) polymerase n=1 Tax=Komagataeibacter swingsii TaxID=215220 RepID=A0A2V4RQ28_9PROT|nr:CCA tRNA nucleotidyltransferase [Komagataeibacter swingsii]PYD71250.1 poly(A) polymerase [Komagataeibacter swingsii]GBQ62577.1 polynucleotide adenylyltransferase [Komagataeibacter swingsii DSM 16373]
MKAASPLDGLRRDMPDVARHLARIWAILPDARLVGGAVRDLLCGRAVADIDLASPHAPDMVMARLEQAGMRVVPTGLSHGTVTAVLDGHPFEITTLRRDEETDGRHATVAWTHDWREDAARRDFTMNAMSCDSAGVVHDYFNGRADLAAGRVRFVGDARLRITEDALRILRFFRFQARYGGDAPEPEAMAAITALSGMIDRLSVERVWAEMRRILVGPHVVRTLAQMHDAGVLAHVLPEGYDIGRLGRLLACGAPAEAVLRLAALVSGDVAAVARRLKLSRADGAALARTRGEPVPLPGMGADVLAPMLADHALRDLSWRAWLRQADLAGQRSAAWDGLRAMLDGMEKPVFPLAGRDVMATGRASGAMVGRVLAQVRQWWLENGCTAGHAACVARMNGVLHDGPTSAT